MGFVIAIGLGLVYTATFLSWVVTSIAFLLQEIHVLIFIPASIQLASRLYTNILLVLAPLLLIGFFFFLFLISREIDTTRTIRFDPIMEPKIVAVLTAYNDALSIGIAAEDFRKQAGVIEVVVVDNNCTDDTAAVARRAGARVVEEPKQGYGYACIKGLQEALANKDANIVVLSEGDGTFHGSDIRKLTAFLENADMIVGTRTTRELLSPDSQLDRFLVWGNLFLGKLIQLKYFDTKHFGAVRLTDVGPYRAIRRSALEKIIGSLRVGKEQFAPHLIITAINSGLKVVEVPVLFSRRIGRSKGAGGSKWKAVRIGISSLWLIIAS